MRVATGDGSKCWHNILERLGQAETPEPRSVDLYMVEPDHTKLVYDSLNSPQLETVTFNFVACQTPVARPPFGSFGAIGFWIYAF